MLRSVFFNLFGFALIFLLSFSSAEAGQSKVFSAGFTGYEASSQEISDLVNSLAWLMDQGDAESPGQFFLHEYDNFFLNYNCYNKDFLLILEKLLHSTSQNSKAGFLSDGQLEACTSLSKTLKIFKDFTWLNHFTPTLDRENTDLIKYSVMVDYSAEKAKEKTHFPLKSLVITDKIALDEVLVNYSDKINLAVIFLKDSPKDCPTCFVIQREYFIKLIEQKYKVQVFVVWWDPKDLTSELTKEAIRQGLDTTSNWPQILFHIDGKRYPSYDNSWSLKNFFLDPQGNTPAVKSLPRLPSPVPPEL